MHLVSNEKRYKFCWILFDILFEIMIIDLSIVYRVRTI